MAAWFRKIRTLFAIGLTLAVSACGSAKHDRTARVAVATNFLTTAQQLEAVFEDQTGHQIDLVPGSTGHLYAQIIQGAPYHVFLAADQARPDAIVGVGLSGPDDQFTYAVGRLALWSPRGGEPFEALQTAKFSRIAMPNPDLAPYGAAARETLQSLDLWALTHSKIVYGQSVSQAYAMAATGNVDLAFISTAAAQDFNDEIWHVPGSMHAPLVQDGVLLKVGKGLPAARAFADFIQSGPAMSIIISNGYNTGP